jgi:NhaP-type Na+/H+ or K+/H+ antiporter
MSVLRRFRATAVVALLWAVLWLPFGVGLNLLVTPLRQSDGVIHWRVVWHVVAEGGTMGGIWGLVNGALFALTLVAAERGRPLDRLSRRRIVIWGAVAGTGVVALLAGCAAAIDQGEVTDPRRLLLTLALGAVYGALLAAGILRITRRAPIT